MSKADVIRSLRLQTGIQELAPKDLWQAPQFPAGIMKGIVVELLGNARTEWLLQFFLQHPEPYIFWCERETLINPTAIHQRGVQLERIKFVNSAGDLQQPLRMALESGHYPFVVAPTRFEEIRVFHRMHLLAERTKSNLFLMAEKEFSQAWPISLQLEINFAGEGAKDGFDLRVQRQKYGNEI